MIPTLQMIEEMKKALVRYSPIMPIDAALSDALSAALALLPGEAVARQWRQSYAGTWGNWNDCGLVDTDQQKWIDLAKKIPNEVQVRPLYAAPAPQPVSVKADAFDKIVAARKVFLDAIDAYNMRLEIVRAERKKGNWLNVDPEYKTSTEALREFWRITQDLADAAIRSALSSPVEGGTSMGVSSEELAAIDPINPDFAEALNSSTAEDSARIIEQCASICDSAAWAPIEGVTHGVWDRAYRQAARDFAARIRKLSTVFQFTSRSVDDIERIAKAIDPLAWRVPEDDYPAERARRDAKRQTYLQQAGRAVAAMGISMVEKNGNIIAAFERDYPELYWHIAKGKITAGEPLYCAIITMHGTTEIGHGESELSAEDAFRIAFANSGLAPLSSYQTPSSAEIEALRVENKTRDENNVGIGMAIAAAIIMRVWGRDTEAREIISAAGLTSEARLREIGVEDYDLDALRPILDETRAALQQQEEGK